MGSWSQADWIMLVYDFEICGKFLKLSSPYSHNP